MCEIFILFAKIKTFKMQDGSTFPIPKILIQKCGFTFRTKTVIINQIDENGSAPTLYVLLEFPQKRYPDWAHQIAIPVVCHYYQE